jgi:hypothetical protein
MDFPGSDDDNHGTFASPGSSANTAAVAVSLEDLFSQPSEIFVLPFQGIAGCTKTERKEKHPANQYGASLKY